MNGRDLRNDNRPLVCVVDETFSSAEEFLTNAQFETLRCLILDVQLPGITGLDLQEKLVTRDIKILTIVLTGHGDIPIAVRAVKAGAVEFLTKPLDDEYLLETVRSAVTRAGVERLLNYAWLGNIRELCNVIQRAASLAQGGALDFDLPMGSPPQEPTSQKSAIGDHNNAGYLTQAEIRRRRTRESFHRAPKDGLENQRSRWRRRALGS